MKFFARFLAFAESVCQSRCCFSGVVIIMAGYPGDMNKMLDTNPGLKSRFTHFIEFEDWSAERLPPPVSASEQLGARPAFCVDVNPS